LVRGEARERKEKVNKIKFPRLNTNLTSGYELCPPPVRSTGDCRMLFSLKKRGERDEARRDETTDPRPIRTLARIIGNNLMDQGSVEPTS
jgi:hypothetical protein